MLEGGSAVGPRFYTKVGVRQPGAASWSRPWQASVEEDGGVLVAEPLIFDDLDPTPRWVSIADSHGQLITVIEVLSPKNKAAGMSQYQEKVRQLRNAGVSVVEIDVIRGGSHAVGVRSSNLPPSKEERSIICVARDLTPGRRQHQVYLTPLTQALPGIRIPLRHAERDAAIAIQPLVDRCYTMGRYWQMNYNQPPEPPLSPELATWAAEKLQAAGLLAQP